MEDGATPAIEAHGLTKRFGDFTAVDALDLRVATGTVVSLLGPNGAGKTTMVRMLATLLRPDGGSARVAGHDVVSEAEGVRRAISLTGQFAALDQHLTARENLQLMARLRGRGRRSARAVVDGLIERFDIGEFRDRLVKDLSGGQRRRVDLASGLIDRPQMLVLDEPTTGLDPRSRQVVWSTVRELVADGVTLLLTTQYLDEADALADRVVLIDHGREIAAGTPAQLKARVGEQRVDVVAADGEAMERLAIELGARFQTTVAREQRTISVPAPDDAADLVEVALAVRDSEIPVDEVALRRPTLDDAFLALTGHPASSESDSPREHAGGGRVSALALPLRYSRDTLLLTARSLRSIPRVPERLLDVTIQPIVFILLFLYVFGSAIHVPGISYKDYLFPGIIGQSLAFGIIGAGVATSRDMTEGVVDRFRSLPISRLSIITAQVMGQFCEALLGMVIVVVFGLLLGWDPHLSAGGALRLGGLLLLGVFAFTWAGVLLGMLVRSPDAMQGLGFIIIFPLAFMAGTFVPIAGMAAVPRTIAYWDPITALVASVRELTQGVHSSGSWQLDHPQLAMVAWCVALIGVCVPLALHRFNRTLAG